MTNAVRPARLATTGRLVLAALVTASLIGCTGRDGTGDERTPDGGNGSSTNIDGRGDQQERRPFCRLQRDQLGGPHHVRALPAEPTADDLSEAAHSAPTRLEAERFAILLNHAIEDQTVGSEGDAGVAIYGSALPIDSVESINEARDFPGNQIVPGSRPWIRSRINAANTEATVHIVEQIEAPDYGDSPGEPYVYWAQTVLSLVWTGERWDLADYQSAGASEYEKFSEFTWRDVMDSGRDWRRFSVE